jgi:amicyanin
MQASRRRIIIAAAFGVALAPLLAAALPPARAAGTPLAIAIDNFTFNPPRVTVRAGTTVTWTNRDDIPHTVTAANKEFKSKPLDTNDAYSFTFTTPGVYEYFCSLHPHMTGTIVVETAKSNAAR